jgi:hypothetical protein
MATDARALFLDEPNSSRTPGETALLWGLVRALRDQSVAVVVVSHRLAELYQVVDRVAVLRARRPRRGRRAPLTLIGLDAVGTPVRPRVDPTVRRPRPAGGPRGRPRLPGRLQRRQPRPVGVLMRPPIVTGVCPVLETPFTAEGEIDEASFAALVEFQVGAGVHGVMFPGFADVTSPPNRYGRRDPGAPRVYLRAARRGAARVGCARPVLAPRLRREGTRAAVKVLRPCDGWHPD